MLLHLLLFFLSIILAVLLRQLLVILGLIATFKLNNCCLARYGGFILIYGLANESVLTAFGFICLLHLL